MFENLTGRLSKTLAQLRGRGRLTEANIKDALREVRMALLEADVALPVVRDFIERVRERAVGQDVLESLSPGQDVIRIVRDELASLMGEANVALALTGAPGWVLVVAGLQGGGKTTTVVFDQRTAAVVVKLDGNITDVMAQLEHGQRGRRIMSQFLAVDLKMHPFGALPRRHDL